MLQQFRLYFLQRLPLQFVVYVINNFCFAFQFRNIGGKNTEKTSVFLQRFSKTIPFGW